MANWNPVCPEQLCERAGNCPTETESDVECVQNARARSVSVLPIRQISALANKSYDIATFQHLITGPKVRGRPE